MSPSYQVEAAGPVPSPTQYAYHEAELAAFLHFGMNTFTDIEWGDGTEDPAIFNPADWKADAMVQALKEAGFTRLVVTAKHHDGFCLWPSAYTDHHVGNSPFKRDLLAELSQACTTWGLDMGLYLSPWDVHEPSYGYGDGDGPETDTNGDYNDYYVNQIEEICSDPRYGRKGHFVEWWLDGAKGEGSMAQDYDFDRWIAAIRAGNPGIDIFGAGAEGGIYWVGNEEGFAPEPCWSKLDRRFKGIGVQPLGAAYGDVWSVPEADVSIYPGWFYHAHEQVKSPAHLGAIYLRSVGRGAPLLLNVPPTKEGDYAEDAYEALRIFGASWRATREPILTATAEELELTAPVQVDDTDELEVLCVLGEGEDEAVLTWRFPSPQVFNLVSLREQILLGQRVSGFKLELLNGDGEWELATQGASVGALRLMTLDRLPGQGEGRAFHGLRLRLQTLSGYAPVVVRSLALHRLAPAWDEQEIYEWLNKKVAGSVPGWTIEEE